ncbi:uncharacterized protein ARMOST_08143 [Armillaria ostoyae]|uniref:Uncharacterized protein n=1 Tax=Armillaria ostoyae TaxID=47428 RepID=A0A284R7U9_ARMOS|nr:uncharacterized protein ARMOST_08143 [Armillaria ostoyae]
MNAHIGDSQELHGHRWDDTRDAADSSVIDLTTLMVKSQKGKSPPSLFTITVTDQGQPYPLYINKPEYLPELVPRQMGISLASVQRLKKFYTGPRDMEECIDAGISAGISSRTSIPRTIKWIPPQAGHASNPQHLSASSSREALSPNDCQLCASGSTHSIDIEVEPPSRDSRPQSTSDHSNGHIMGFLNPNHTPTILPLEPPEHRPMIPAIPMDSRPSPQFHALPQCRRDERLGNAAALPATTTLPGPGPQQASGFGAPRTPTLALPDTLKSGSQLPSSRVERQRQQRLLGFDFLVFDVLIEVWKPVTWKPSKRAVQQYRILRLSHRLALLVGL